MSDDLKLDPEAGGTPKAAGVTPARYKKPLADYVKTYGRKVRVLKDWIATGRDAVPPVLPPFDEPPRMLAWWKAHKKNRPPDILLTLATKAEPKKSANVATTPPVTATTAPAGPLFEGVVATATASAEVGVGSISPHATGFSASLNRQRIAEAKAGELHNSLVAAAIAATDPDLKMRLQTAAEQANRQWASLTSEMRKAEADAPKILAAAGKNWDADAVVAALHEIHVPMRDGIKALVRRVRPLLADLPGGEQDALWDREVEKLFTAWRRNKFIAAALPAPDAHGT